MLSQAFSKQFLLSLAKQEKSFLSGLLPLFRDATTPLCVLFIASCRMPNWQQLCPKQQQQPKSVHASQKNYFPKIVPWYSLTSSISTFSVSLPASPSRSLCFLFEKIAPLTFETFFLFWGCHSSPYRFSWFNALIINTSRYAFFVSNLQ